MLSYLGSNSAITTNTDTLYCSWSTGNTFPIPASSVTATCEDGIFKTAPAANSVPLSGYTVDTANTPASAAAYNATTLIPVTTVTNNANP
jgi:hypothetical protein